MDPGQTLKSQKVEFYMKNITFADRGCLFWIPDLKFTHPGSRVKKIPDPGSASASKEFKYF
jgi:hypothetical protein